jgi:hypothetical protein
VDTFGVAFSLAMIAKANLFARFVVTGGDGTSIGENRGDDL